MKKPDDVTKPLTDEEKEEVKKIIDDIEKGIEQTGHVTMINHTIMESQRYRIWREVERQAREAGYDVSDDGQGLRIKLPHS